MNPHIRGRDFVQFGKTKSALNKRAKGIVLLFNPPLVLSLEIIHDLGEAFTGDIPAFEKTTTNEATEEELLYSWVKSLPENYAKEMFNLYDEMAKRETAEAKVYKAIDSLEALVQHNISDLSTWIPKEYELNKTYADDKVAFSEYLKELREEIRKDTLEKLGKQ